MSIKLRTNEAVGSAQYGFALPSLTLLSSGVTSRPATETYTDYKRQGFFGQAKYALKGKYLIDGTLRRDGSSRFGANSKYGWFYAGSAAWVMSQEDFLKGVSWLSELKLRGSYGKVGNSELNTNYGSITSFGAATAGFQYLGGALLRPTRLGNDLLSWESEYQTNIGFDYAVLNNRIYGSVQYFNNQTKDLLYSVPLPADAGAPLNTIVLNTAAVLNRGFEVEIGAVVVDKGSFKWKNRLQFFNTTQ